MTTSAVTSLLNVQNADSVSGTANTSSKTMDKEAFLKLLVAQMSNQDPLEPMDNKDMVLQLAQFSSIEGTNNLNNNFTSFMNTNNLTVASSMIGKTVVYSDATTGYDVMGNVSKVNVNGSKIGLVVDGKEIEMYQISSVLPTTTPKA